MTIGRVFYVSCEACVIASLLRVAHHCAAVRPPAKSDRRARPLILAQSRSASGSPLVGPPPPLPGRSAPAYHSRTDSYLPLSRSEAACPLKSSISLRRRCRRGCRSEEHTSELQSQS